jgi:hypothetical protein
MGVKHIGTEIQFKSKFLFQVAADFQMSKYLHPQMHFLNKNIPENCFPYSVEALPPQETENFRL